MDLDTYIISQEDFLKECLKTIKKFKDFKWMIHSFI